jgi:hypothetical protein
MHPTQSGLEHSRHASKGRTLLQYKHSATNFRSILAADVTSSAALFKIFY